MRSSHATVLTVTGAVCLALSVPSATSALSTSADGADRVLAPYGQSRSTVDSGHAIVRLAGAPLATSPRTAPTKSKRVDLRSTAARSERAALAAERNAFKKWLQANAPRAQVTGEFDLALNAVAVRLGGTTLETLRAAPGVSFVEMQGVFTPVAHEDPDLQLIRGQQAWSAAGGEASAGAGVKVAIIDSGIDVSHPCFDDAGYAASPQVGDPAHTNNKVVVSRVYGNKVAKNGLGAADLNGHGTHVAGTVACNAHTPASVDGAGIPYDPSGVAPAATLGAYNVFPGSEGSARSEDILEAMEDAYADGFDVANMSLGGARNDGGGAFLLDNAVDNLDRANMVVAVAAGNEGPGYWTVHYPGAAPRALTAGASTVGHAVVRNLLVAGAEHDMAIGDFGDVTTDLTAPLRVVPDPAVTPQGLSTACDSDPALPTMTGQIAVLARGVCDFTVKVRNAQNAGAVAAVVVNREEALLTMSHNGLEPQPTIPGVMITLSDGLEVVTHDGENATIPATGTYKTFPELTNRMASFSSQGPTHGDLLIKPDVVAPGADVLSAQPAWTCEEDPCWTFLGGTSMATPHLAGIAAVVRGAHPAWSAAEVRSAVVNTAQQNVLTHPETGAVTNDALIVGAGLADAAAAVGSSVALDPVSLSFGAISKGAGSTVTRSLRVTNTSDSATSVSVVVSGDAPDGVTFRVTPGTAALAPGASTTVTVTATPTKGAAEAFYQAQVDVRAGGAVAAHGMLFTVVGQGVAAPGQHQTPPGQLS
ncbi:S8 family serine peptidase [Knoellia sp. CPCC 206435]|uniref:S8 family serine peptidase n=1 Tax=Knoellia terrae TaxID=3404797 RepID=UPI003B432F3A